MAKIDKDPKKQKAKSDSLMRESERKKAFAKTQLKIANAQIKRGTGKEPKIIGYRNGELRSTPTATERLKIGNDGMMEARRDSIASVNLRPKAIKAAKPSPMPKPRKSTRK
jgi:hypothetical protein